MATLGHPQAGKAEGDTQFPKQGALLSGHLARLVEAVFSSSSGPIPGLLEQHLAFDAEQFGDIPLLAVFPSPGRLDRLAHGIVCLVEPPQSRERKGERSHKLRVGELPASLIAGVEGFTKDGQALLELVAFDQQLAAPFWTMVGQFLRGKLLVERHQFAEGLAVLREAFDTCNQTGWRLSYPEFMGSFALALRGLGRLDEAHDAVCKAIEAAGGREDGQQWYVPELLRIKGEVLLRQTSNQAPQVAADCFAQAAEMACEQGALFWELRVALSLARLRVTQARHDEARRILAPVYDRFTEGFVIPDLRAARAILEPPMAS